MKTKVLLLSYCFLHLLLFSPVESFASADFTHLFGFTAQAQLNMNFLPQWLSVLERHINQDVPEGDCTETMLNRCHLKNWLAFLTSIRNKPRIEQINAVNLYANNKNYILDMANYGQEDYWAIAKQFLSNGGDCEDYAITKFFSLRWLGMTTDELRVVVLQDTNLRIAHAVLAVSYNNDILILDNQTQRVVSHKKIAHYFPLYSVNEKQWWLHLPRL